MNLATRLTVLRIMLSALLYPLAYYQQRLLFIVIFFIAAATDLLDGYLARRYKQSSEEGAKLDTFADQFMLVSCAYYAYYLEPEIVWHSAYPYVVGLWIVLNNIVCWNKHKRLANFHLYSAKLGTFGLLFAVLWAITFGFNATIYWIATGLIAIAALETSLVVLFVKKPKTNRGSYFLQRYSLIRDRL